MAMIPNHGESRKEQMTFMRSLHLLSSILMILCSACTVSSDDNGRYGILTALIGSDEVTAQASDSTVVIFNNTAEAVYYTAFPRDVLPVILWAPCVDPPRCKSIMPGRSATLPFANFMMESRDDEAVVFWWHLIRQSDGTYEYDEIRSIWVKL